MSTITIIQGNSNDKDNARAYMVKGEKGDKGDIGTSNTITIGTVTKGAEAEATMTGTSPNQVLNLVLPQGDKGDKGDKGDPGSAGYEVPAGSVVGWDSTDPVPAGYTEMQETITTLLDWTQLTSSSSHEYTLEDDMTKYKYLYIMFSGTNTDIGGATISQVILTTIFKNIHANIDLTLYQDMADTNYYAKIKYISDTKVASWKSAELQQPYLKIVGINF